MTRHFSFITIALVLVCLGLHYALWAGDKNAFHLKSLQRNITQIDNDNQKLHQRNQKLLAEIIDLKEGGETIETLARSELGLIKENETFYQIIE